MSTGWLALEENLHTHTFTYGCDISKFICTYSRMSVIRTSVIRKRRSTEQLKFGAPLPT